MPRRAGGDRSRKNRRRDDIENPRCLNFDIHSTLTSAHASALTKFHTGTLARNPKVD